jgi:hypothetical protein
MSEEKPSLLSGTMGPMQVKCGSTSKSQIQSTSADLKRFLKHKREIETLYFSKIKVKFS